MEGTNTKLIIILGIVKRKFSLMEWGRAQYGNLHATHANSFKGGASGSISKFILSGGTLYSHKIVLS